MGAKAIASRRRGILCEAVVRVCGENALTVSTALSWVVVGELEKLGIVRSQGRELEFDKNAAEAMSPRHRPGRNTLQAFESELHALEAVAQERLDRRKKRQKAREKGRV